jgi:hypothetical protein
MEEGIENLKNKEFRVFGIKVTFMTASAALAVVGSVIGTLYGGFLMYQKVEQAIAFVEQQTEYEEKIAGFEQRMEIMGKELAATKGSVQEATGYANEIKNDLKGDIRRLEGVVDSVERSSKQLQRETLQDVKEVQGELRAIRKEVDDKIKKALDNPLANQ